MNGLKLDFDNCLFRGCGCLLLHKACLLDYCDANIKSDPHVDSYALWCPKNCLCCGKSTHEAGLMIMNRFSPQQPKILKPILEIDNQMEVENNEMSGFGHAIIPREAVAAANVLQSSSFHQPIPSSSALPFKELEEYMEKSHFEREKSIHVTMSYQKGDSEELTTKEGRLCQDKYLQITDSSFCLFQMIMSALSVLVVQPALNLVPTPLHSHDDLLGAAVSGCNSVLHQLIFALVTAGQSMPSSIDSVLKDPDIQRLVLGVHGVVEMILKCKRSHRPLGAGLQLFLAEAADAFEVSPSFGIFSLISSY